MRHAFVTLLLVAVAAGCGESPEPRASLPAAAVPAVPPPGTETREGARPQATRVLGAADSTCPRVGWWRQCSVEDRLVRAGLAPQRADSAPAPIAGSVGTARYWLGDVELQVYLFPDSVARTRAEREAGDQLGEPPLLDAAQGAPRSAVSSANLAAVIYGARPRQVERVSLAISAGLPPG